MKRLHLTTTAIVGALLAVLAASLPVGLPPSASASPAQPAPGPIAQSQARYTIRRLEGDVTSDCIVRVDDMQQVANRYLAARGTLLYSPLFDVSLPTPNGVIDVQDLQFVFGRVNSTCANPIPAQPPASLTVTPPNGDITLTKSPTTANIWVCTPGTGDCGSSVPTEIDPTDWQNGIVVDEIMTINTPVPAVNEYAFDFLYDASLFQPPAIADQGVLDTAGATTTCTVDQIDVGHMRFDCKAVGPSVTWTGAKTVAKLTMLLQSSVTDILRPAKENGITTDIFDTQATTGQPSPSPTPTGTATATSSPTSTATGSPTSTPSAVPTATDTPTPTNTPVTPTATNTPGTPTATNTPGTPTVTNTPGTPTATNTPGTPTPSRTPGTPTASTTPGTPLPGTSTPVATSSAPAATHTPQQCSYDHDHWRDHDDEWPTDHLHLGRDEYNRDELIALLRANASSDPSIALAQELVAAKFNAAAGRPAPPADLVALGDSLLANGGDRVPQHQSNDDYRGKGMLWVAESLHRHEHDDDCESRTEPETRAPTPVNTVLSNTRRNNPSGLPLTGLRSSFRHDAQGWIIATMAIVIVSLLVVLVRQTIGGADRKE